MHLFIYLKKKMTTFPRYYISIMNNHSREIRYRCKRKRKKEGEKNNRIRKKRIRFYFDPRDYNYKPRTFFSGDKIYADFQYDITLSSLV